MLKTTVFFDESFFGKFNRLGGFKEQLLLFVTTAHHTVIFLNLMEENSELCKKYCKYQIKQDLRLELYLLACFKLKNSSCYRKNFWWLGWGCRGNSIISSCTVDQPAKWFKVASSQHTLKKIFMIKSTENYMVMMDSMMHKKYINICAKICSFRLKRK